MKNLSIATIVEKNKLASDQVFLIALAIEVKNPLSGQIDDTIYIVRNDEEVTIDGQVYEPMPFEITMEENAEGLPSVSLQIQDQEQLVQAYMQSYAGGVGFPVTLIVLTGGDKDSLSSEADLTEFFEIVSASSDSGGYTSSWELGVENPLAIRFPRRRQHTDQCSFRYKSNECGYSGGLSTCDFTLGGDDGCRVHENAERFGGYPGLIARG
jgi:phage-related protein